MQIYLLKVIPQNLLSFLTGTLSRLRFPLGIQPLLNQIFVKIFGIQMNEAELDVWAYRSIEDVFVRRLKPGSRRIDPASSVVSPCDGTVTYSKPLLNGSDLIQAKGIYYSALEIIWGEGACEPNPNFQPGWFSTIYLAPHNYHRVHTPVAGRLLRVRYLPGALYPVNNFFTENFPRLYAVNERMVFEIRSLSGAMVYVVMVGAFNVGRIESTVYPFVIANDLLRQFGGVSRQEVALAGEGKLLEKGDELGVFMLGSTVVVVYEKDFMTEVCFREISEKTPIMLGESLSHPQ